MKHTGKILISIAALVALGVSVGFAVRKHRAEISTELSELANQRKSAEALRDELRSLYSERLDLLEKIDPKGARQIRDRATSLSLDSKEGLEQYDYFQNVASESFAKWIATPQSKNSPILEELKALETRLDRKRAEFHAAAFALNDGIARLRAQERPMAVFKAEALLKTQKTSDQTAH